MNQELIKQELSALRNPATLASRLAQIDEAHDFRRIYVMGCGRSGTWLLAGLFATFADLELVPAELGFEHFGLYTTKKRVLLLKRDYAAHLRIEQIPACIEIAYIVRHPFDVLTSHNPATNRTYHVEPHTWLSEMVSLQYLLDSQRDRTTIIKYEDLVREPHLNQAMLAARLELRIEHPVEMLGEVFEADAGTVSAMHGLRAIDTKSVGGYRKDPQKQIYLKSIRPRLGRLLNWVGDEYGYDVSI